MFLSIQLRANSAALRAQTKQALADNVQGRFLAIATSPELSAIIAKVRKGTTWEGQNDTEAEQFRNWAAISHGKAFFDEINQFLPNDD